MSRRVWAVIAALAAAAPLDAVADPSSTAGDEGLGTPLPGPSALPAMASVTPYVMSFDVADVPGVPRIDLGDGTQAPRRSEVFTGMSVRMYAGGYGLRSFGFYSMGTTLGFGIAGESTKPFSTAAGTYTNGSARMFSLELPSPGTGYQTRDWLVAAQLVPSIQWFSANFDRGDMKLNGREHLYTLAADLQACRQYNFLGMFPKNSAACVYVAPVIYRDGWLSGATFGIRWYPL